jgi:GntR family transcriptional regulator
VTDPLYRRIAEDLREKIESGVLARGSQLPTELSLRDRYEASRNTVRDAVRWLTTRGLVETRPGHGTFVTEQIDPYVTVLTGDPASASYDEGPVYRAEVEAVLRAPTVSRPRAEIRLASGVIQSELGLAEGSSVVSRHQRRFIDGTAWSLQTSFYPIKLVERGAMRLIQAPNIDEGTVAYLREELGIRLAGYRDKITVRPPGTDEAKFFGLPDDGRVAVFEIFRTVFDEGGEPFLLTVSVYPADRNQFIRIVGNVPAAETDPAPDDEVHAGSSGRHHA